MDAWASHMPLLRWKEDMDGKNTNACTIHGNVAWKTTTGCLQYKSDLTSVGCFVCPYVREILPVKAGGWQLVVKVQKIW